MALWFAYILALAVASSALGVITRTALDVCSNISQFAVALYIFLLRRCSDLPKLSVLVCLAGFIKCFEHIKALCLATTENLHDSMLGPPAAVPNYHKFLEDFLLRKSQGFDEKWRRSLNSPLQSINHLYPEEGKEISEAYDLFQTFRRLFVDLILTFKDRDSSQSYFRHLESSNAFGAVAIELGFA
ncbi:hypothetical protein Tco_0991806, partial [Tanacetum coccineum]